MLARKASQQERTLLDWICSLSNCYKPLCLADLLCRYFLLGTPLGTKQKRVLNYWSVNRWGSGQGDFFPAVYVLLRRTVFQAHNALTILHDKRARARVHREVNLVNLMSPFRSA